MKTIIWTFLAFSLSAAASSINISLVNSSLSGTPGTVLKYFGTLTNTTADIVFLNSAGATSVSSDLTIDFSPFFLNAPGFLGPNESTGPIELFDIILGLSVAPGTYVGNTFSIQGGANELTFDPVGDVSADATAVNPVTSVPEPSTLVLLGLGLAAIRPIRRMRTSTMPGRRP